MMMRFLPILFWLFSLGIVQAEETPLPQCPSGKFEAVVSFSDDSDDNNKVIFRLAGTATTIGTFGLNPYSRYARLLWSPDGRFAALQTHSTRHTMELFVLAVTENGIKEAKLQDYTQNIYGRLDIVQSGRGHADTPLKWLENDLLLIQAAGAIDKGDDAGYCYRVELRIIGEESPEGWLEKVEKAEVLLDGSIP